MRNTLRSKGYPTMQREGVKFISSRFPRGPTAEAVGFCALVTPFKSRETRCGRGASTILRTMLLRLGHSPDLDDALMFYALAQDPPLIDTGAYRFEHVLQDIQTLNQRATRGEPEITAMSIHVYPYVADKYFLTPCGSSLGDKYGPMVATREPITIDRLLGKKIAIPGELTTAFLALQLCLGKAGDAFEYEVVHFDQIPKHVRDGKVDAGLIIHEGQLTYKTLGLHLVVDLGAWWHERTDLPLPLGGKDRKSTRLNSSH